MRLMRHEFTTGIPI